MRRHLILGRLGPLDLLEIPAAQDEFVTSVDLIASSRRLIPAIDQALADLNKIGVYPSELGLDLLVVAVHVYLADTRISRDTESQDTWTREIRLVIPVSDPMKWDACKSHMEGILRFLTGDRWLIGFRARPSEHLRLAPTRPTGTSECRFDVVSLFSGGLDSLIGAIDLVEAGASPLLVSHSGDGAASSAQDECFRGLKSHFASRMFDRIRVWLNFPNDTVKDVAPESTTRGRSFLFFAIGALAGTGLERPFVLRVPENGLISLNVPLDILRLGSHSTRTTHPFYIARWNELLAMLGIEGRIENPYWNRTKGQMIAACANQALLRQLLPISLSCSSPSKGRWQGHGIEHCGYCLPCLIRRASVLAAWGPNDDPTRYTIAHLSAQNLDTRKAEGQQVRSFQFAIRRLRARPGVERILIHKPGSLADEIANLAELASVYRRGMDEVARLLDDVVAEPS